jgi:predicted permease
VWNGLLGRDPSVIGRTLWLGTKPVVVTGVMGKDFLGLVPRAYEGFVLVRQTASWLDERKRGALLTDPRRCCVEIFGRLRSGATREQAAAEIETRVNPVHASLGLPLLRVVPWSTAMASRPGGVRDTVPTLFALLFTGCGIVTLLACANIGNLQLARGLRRTREIAVRLSLGAGRGRVIRQLLTESAVLSLIGTAGGLVIAWTLPGAIMALEGESMALTFVPERWVFFFAPLTGAAAAALFGLAPALRITRIDWRGATSGIAGSAGRLRSMLLGLQVALSLGLIASAALLSRGALHAASGANAGFAFEGRYTYSFAVSGDGVGAAARQAVIEAVTAGATRALVDPPPWRASQPRAIVSASGAHQVVTASWTGVNPAAIAMLELPIVAGRWPVTDSRLSEVAISRSLARALWQDDSAIGRTIDAKFGDSAATWTVVGLMDEVRLAGPNPMPAVVTTYRSAYLPVVLGGPGRTAELQAIAQRFDPSIRVVSRSLLDDLRRQFQGAFVGISVASGLGLIALLLASLGLCGVFAYLVEDRRREMGVRLALGARPADIRRSVAAVVRGPIAGGLAAGLALALVGGSILRQNLFGLSILDPLSYAAVAAILAFSALVATAIPLRRATRVDPAITLRQE